MNRMKVIIKQANERPANCLIRQFINFNISRFECGEVWLRIRFAEAEKLLKDNPLPVTEAGYFLRECLRAFPENPYGERASSEGKSFWGEVFRFSPDPEKVYNRFWGK